MMRVRGYAGSGNVGLPASICAIATHTTKWTSALPNSANWELMVGKLQRAQAKILLQLTSSSNVKPYTHQSQMKREGNRILLTLKEAEDIERCLDTLSAMEGVYDQDFNKECHIAETLSSKIFKLRNNQYVDEPIIERLTTYEADSLRRLHRGFTLGGTPSGLETAAALRNIFGDKIFEP